MLLTELTLQDNSATAQPKKSVKKQEAPVVVPKPKSTMPSTPATTKGVFPCLFTLCGYVLPACRLLNHVRSFHNKHLTEVSENVVEI